MENDLNILKGIPPGTFLTHELHKRKLSTEQFARAIGEYPQVISDITNAERRLTPGIALKLDRALGKKDGFFLLLQAWFETYEEKRKEQTSFKPDLKQLRPGVFWDTDINRIDWDKQSRAVIQRVSERGNDQEKNEITRFYGFEKIMTTLAALKGKTDTPRPLSKRHLKP